MIKVLMPYISLHGLPIVATLRRVKEAGFDGIEQHLVGASHHAVLATTRRAHERGLAVHLHQAWSLAENPTHWHNYVLKLAGCLPRTGYTLAEHVPFNIVEAAFHDGVTWAPVVVYANRIPEVMNLRRWRRNFWIQTCMPPGGQPQMDFAVFLTAVKMGKLKVVFDTQHALEFAGSCKGVSELPTDRGELLNRIQKLWGLLANNVNEIHLADFNPALGNTRGRNVPLGTGVLPLREFCRMVRESGWEGFVVPEVSGMFWRTEHLHALRKQVDEFFA